MDGLGWDAMGCEPYRFARISAACRSPIANHTLSIIFPFHSVPRSHLAEDSVYLDNEDWRREYVLNDVGKIYIGSHSKPKGRKWIYGQVSNMIGEKVVARASPSEMLASMRSSLALPDRRAHRDAPIQQPVPRAMDASNNSTH